MAAPTAGGGNIPTLLRPHMPGKGAKITYRAPAVEPHIDGDIATGWITFKFAYAPLDLMLVLGQTGACLVVNPAHTAGELVKIIDGQQSLR